jgi:hypothetical protein
LIRQGACQASAIVRTFGVSVNSVKRSVKKLREQGIESFYQPRRGRGATVITPEIVSEAQARLYRGELRHQVAEQLGLKPETLRKAILQGRVSEPRREQQAAVPPPADPAATPGQGQASSPEHPHVETVRDECPPPSRLEPPLPATDKSQRTRQDAAAAEGLGVGCTRVLDRVAAALGLLPGGAATQFAPCRDVALGGVLCALPALAQNGLFRHLDTCFTSLGGYYTTLQVMTLLGYMALDQQRRSLQSQLTKRQARYAALTLHPESDPAEVPPWERRKAVLVEEVQRLEHALEEVKQKQQKTASHLAWEELPKEAQCERLAPGRKRLLDAVRMIAYRAETAMVGILREELSRADDARSLVRDLFGRAADILPDKSSGTLRVQVHASANPRLDRAIGHLLEHLNATEQTYPGTTLRLTYTLVGLP